MNKILVTGGSSMVGKSLKDLGVKGRYSSSSVCDLRKPSEVSHLLNYEEPDIVIHLAAKVSGIQANIADPYGHFYDNVMMNTNVIDECVKRKVPRFIGILSSCIYPDVASSYPLMEEQLHESVPTPSNFSYGYAKRMMAVQIEASNHQFGTNYSYLIPCNLYGKYDKYGESNSHFVASLIKKIHNAKKEGKESITLFGTGKPIRQFMLASDFAYVIKYCIENNINESMNVCPDESYTIDEIARIALEACDATHLEIVYDSSMPDGQYRKDICNKKMKRIIPNMKFTSLRDGIRKTYLEYCFETAN
jgi:GDP-L-fucose synthase